jgi:uncharacterized membrane protein YqhA
MEPGQTFICVLFGFFLIIVSVEIYQYFVRKPDIENGYVRYVSQS